MKKIRNILLLTPTLVAMSFSAAFLTACEAPFKAPISFGTYFEDHHVELDGFNKVISKINVTHESFILTVYPNNSCSCWAVEFQSVLNEFVKEKHVRAYSINEVHVKAATNKYGFTYSDESPVLFFVDQNARKIQIDYYSGYYSPFVDVGSFIELFEKYCSYPSLYMVDENYLNNNLALSEKQIVHYVWDSCPDCKDSFPNVVFPYTRNHSLQNKIWVYDLDDIKDNTEEYTRIRNKFHLSEEGDATFGYLNGKVPTTQYYENGVLIDMNVYFNDVIEKRDEKYYVANSYFSEERISNLQYVTASDVLAGKEISADDVTEYEGKYYWKKTAARVYHANYLDRFLTKYAK